MFSPDGKTCRIHANEDKLSFKKIGRFSKNKKKIEKAEGLDFIPTYAPRLN